MRYYVLMEFTTWKPGDIAIDPCGRKWKVVVVDDGNIFEYPELGVELIDSPAADGYKDIMSSRLLKKAIA